MAPKLVIPRRTAEAKLKKQIATGEELLKWSVRDSAADYQQFQDEVRLWKSYSISLVATFFDTDEINRSLNFSSTIAMPHSPIPAKWEQRKRETNFFLVSLRSILKNLALYKRAVSEKDVSDRNVSKELVMNHTINVSGSNARVNVNSTDSSTNTVNQGISFAELRKAIEVGVADGVERAAILESLAGLESATDKESGLKRYQAFITSAHHHMALLGPYLPALGHWVHGLMG